MTSTIALALTLFLIAYLIRRDQELLPLASSAVWIPTIWLLINGSRQPSQWFGTGRALLEQALHQGNPVDQVVYGSLIVAGICVLARRQVRFRDISRYNVWIILFFLYEGISFVWSDFPFLTFKRWIKASGDLVMVLVLCTDPMPTRAITAMIKRSGYVLIPLSLLFCKFYEHMGRTFDAWGRSYYTGVTLDKNMFGYLLFAYGLFFTSALVRAFDLRTHQRETTGTPRLSSALLVAMVAWLTPIANSKTSLLALLAGIAVVLGLQISVVRRHFWPYLFATVLCVALANELFSIQSVVFEATGRDATLTGRTGIWETVLKEPNNPLVGTGYASFWLGERLERIWAIYPRTPLIQAHNGYIEIYLNLGLIGVVLIGGVLWTGLRSTWGRLADAASSSCTEDDEYFYTFAMAYSLAYLLYNVTEATFVGTNFLFVIFLALAAQYRREDA